MLRDNIQSNKGNHKSYISGAPLYTLTGSSYFENVSNLIREILNPILWGQHCID